MKCPNCAGTVQVLSQPAMFCLNCDWDNLEETRFFQQDHAPVDAEWYTKTQLKEYRRWKDDDFLRVQPDWIGGYGYNNRRGSGYQTYYFHRETVENLRSDTAISEAGEPLAEIGNVRVSEDE